MSVRDSVSRILLVPAASGATLHKAVRLLRHHGAMVETSVLSGLDTVLLRAALAEADVVVIEAWTDEVAGLRGRALVAPDAVDVAAGMDAAGLVAESYVKGDARSLADAVARVLDHPSRRRFLERANGFRPGGGSLALAAL